MIIKEEYPPNIEEIKKHFVVPYEAVFCYGDILYVPGGGEVDEALMKHEETHSRQQAQLGIERWWELYLHVPDFRLSQEVEAYQNQYREQSRGIKDRNELNRYLTRLASDLASPMYGRMMSYSDARKAIRSEQLITFDLSKLK